jgi:peroxiredoxin
LNHGTFDLATDAADHFTLMVFYRGLHCPLCMKYLLELARLVPDFENLA